MRFTTQDRAHIGEDGKTRAILGASHLNHLEVLPEASERRRKKATTACSVLTVPAVTNVVSRVGSWLLHYLLLIESEVMPTVTKVCFHQQQRPQQRALLFSACAQPAVDIQK